MTVENKKVTDLDLITTLPDSGLMYVIDPTNLTQNPSGSSFRMTKANYLKENTAAILLNTAKVSFDSTSSTRLADTSGTNTGDQDISGKQNTLVSATNIKTINGATLLGSGDLVVSGGVIGSGTINRIAKFTASGAVGDSLLSGDANGLAINSSGTGFITFVNALQNRWLLGGGGGNVDFNLFNFTTNSYSLIVKQTTGNLLINTTTDNGVDKLQVNGSASFTGNVGIGTTTPTTKLQVAGEISTNDNYYTTSPNRGYWIGAIGTFNSGMYYSAALRFRSGAESDKMILLDNGNLLLNTTTDNGVDKLQVNGSAKIKTPTYIYALTLGNPDGDLIKLGGGSGGRPSITSLTGEMDFNSDSTNLNRTLSLRPTGLHLGAGYGKIFGEGSQNFIDYSEGGSGNLKIATTLTNPITFLTNNIERLRINTVGDVGIGTTTPPHNLTVSSTNSSTEIGLYNTNTASASNRNWLIGTTYQNFGDLNFFVSNIAGGNPKASPPKISISTAGRVMIGTSVDNGTDALQVNGSVSVTTLKTSGFTVATLPTPPAQGLGARAHVTDALNPTYLGTLTGGGTVKCPVFYNGTNWVSS